MQGMEEEEDFYTTIFSRVMEKFIQKRKMKDDQTRQARAHRPDIYFFIIAEMETRKIETENEERDCIDIFKRTHGSSKCPRVELPQKYIFCQ